MGKRRFDIDGYYTAIRPRLRLNAISGGGATVCPPHTHSASEITFEPEPTQALISGDDCQEVGEELGSEKLARSGEQPWLGPQPLDMNHFSITNILDAEVESDLTMSGPVGEAIIDQPRVIHMAGDKADDEAKIDGLERVVFNNEPTASSIELPSRQEWNTGVTSSNMVRRGSAKLLTWSVEDWDFIEDGGSYSVAAGKMSWDITEGTMVLHVVAGAGYYGGDLEMQIAPVAHGWLVKQYEYFDSES